MRLASCLAFVAALTPFTSAYAAGVDGRALVLHGDSHGVPACAACHGQNGEGNAQAGYPRLAGLDAGYLERQLAAFASGARQSPIMTPVAKAMTGEERDSVAKYFAALSTPTPAAGGQTADPALLAAGAKLARRGDWSKGLPGCGQCHGAAGLGVGADFPALAGQSSTYIVAEIKAFKDRARKDDPMGLMTGVASKLSDDQVKAAAAYYASLPNPVAASPSAAAAAKDQQK